MAGQNECFVRTKRQFCPGRIEHVPTAPRLPFLNIARGQDWHGPSERGMDSHVRGLPSFLRQCPESRLSHESNLFTREGTFRPQRLKNGDQYVKNTSRRRHLLSARVTNPHGCMTDKRARYGPEPRSPPISPCLVQIHLNYPPLSPIALYSLIRWNITNIARRDRHSTKFPGIEMQRDENMTPFSIENLLVNSPWLTISREKRERGANHPGGKAAHECLAFQRIHRSTTSTRGMGRIPQPSTRLGKLIQSIYEEAICHFLARPEARSFFTLLLHKINNHPHEIVRNLVQNYPDCNRPKMTNILGDRRL